MKVVVVHAHYNIIPRKPVVSIVILNARLLVHHKHLSIWLESSLSRNYHISTICANDNRVLGLIRRTFGPWNLVSIVTAYKVLVRPILEYARPMWNPYLVKDVHAIHAIESVQRRASRLICNPGKACYKKTGGIEHRFLRTKA